MNEKIHSILLVDWPSRDIPFALIQSGFLVFSYSPDGYTHALMESNLPKDSRGLVFHPLKKPPVVVDLVMIYRPQEEHATIIRDQVLPLGAKMVWLQPPVESMETKTLADELGLSFVQGRDIREIAQ